MHSSCRHLWMAWLECLLCPGEEPEAVVLDTTESCCRQTKPSLHLCTTCWSNWWKCPTHKCVTSHAGFLTHFLNSHNPSPADQFLIKSNGLQTAQEFQNWAATCTHQTWDCMPILRFCKAVHNGKIVGMYNVHVCSWAIEWSCSSITVEATLLVD